MGAYSRKDMIEFAKFAKSYSTSPKVERAYKKYLSGGRLGGRGQIINIKENGIQHSNIST